MITRSAIAFGIVVMLLLIYPVIVKKGWFSSFEVSELLDKYSEEEIEHFAYFAFSSGRIIKWKNDIRISIASNSIILPDKMALVNESIETCVDQLNNLMQEVRVNIVSKQYNVNLSLKDSISLSVQGFAPVFTSIFKLPYPTATSGYIDVLIKDLDIAEINATVFHEFSHLLGFHHNLELYQESNWTYKSLFNPPSKTFVDSLDRLVEDFTEYSDLDKAAIRIMYDKEVAIDPGLTRQKFDRLIEEAKKKMK